MHDDEEPADDGLRRNLLDQLQSISTSLNDGDAADAAGDDDIPLLVDVVDLPRPAAATTPAPASVPATRKDTQDIIEIEAERIVDELIDEFLPRIEARLRERLEERRHELVRSGSREPGGA